MTRRRKGEKSASTTSSNSSSSSSSTSNRQCNHPAGAKKPKLLAETLQQQQQQQPNKKKPKPKKNKKNKKSQDASKVVGSDAQASTLNPQDVKVACNVFVVRHAERCEDMDQSAFWKASGRVYDPTITEKGREQALAAAHHLIPVCKERNFTCIYTSPLIRCVETACIVAAQLGIPVKIVNGLAGCTRALRNKDVAQVEFASTEEAAEHCRCKATGVALARADIPLGSPFEAILDVTTLEMGRDVLICTHREAIRQLLLDAEEDATAQVAKDSAPLAGEQTNDTGRRGPVSRKQLGFCCVSRFAFDEKDCVFRFLSIAHPTNKNEGAKKEKHREKKKRQRKKLRAKRRERKERWLARQSASKDEEVTTDADHADHADHANEGDKEAKLASHKRAGDEKDSHASKSSPIAEPHPATAGEENESGTGDDSDSDGEMDDDDMVFDPAYQPHHEGDPDDGE